ncbi:MAG: MmgE/PrpD family protein [Chloroflexi bacterium]|nr:MmgE/PrpD family protein [Chloroflexota bacterium]
MSRTLAQTLADFAADLSFEHLPPEVIESVKLRFLDTIGICLASRHFGLADGVQQMVDSWGGTTESDVVGGGKQCPAPNAALVNGTLAHSLDFDDTHLPSVLHPSASIVPAVLAMAQSTGRSGREALLAATAGIETTVRIGMAGYLPEAGNVYFERGWHATSICGTLGAAVAGAKLLGLDAEGIANAVGIAASFGSGVIEGNRAGGTVKRVHCGWAAHAGLTAALLAHHGMSGPPTALEGRFGLFEAFLSGQFDPTPITRIDQCWEIPGILFKPYPANHYTHAGIDAALAIRSQIDDVAQITRIELGAAASPLRTIGEPREEKIRPRSGYHAQFSGPFTVATALLGGGGLGVYFDDFTDAMARDPARLALAARVSTFVDAECDAAFPRAFSAVLRVQLKDGRVLEHRVMQNRVLTEDEVRQKFELNARLWLEPEATSRVTQAVLGLEHAERVDGVMALTGPGSRAPA